jgi:hypothetical protein
MWVPLHQTLDGAAAKGGGTPGGGATSPQAYIRRGAPSPQSIPLAFAFSHSLFLTCGPKYWRVHTGLRSLPYARRRVVASSARIILLPLLR